jgi:hypothetical protein
MQYQGRPLLTHLSGVVLRHRTTVPTLRHNATSWTKNRRFLPLIYVDNSYWFIYKFNWLAAKFAPVNGNIDYCRTPIPHQTYTHINGC